MTIVIDTSDVSTGSDYTWLAGAVASWLNRPDLAANVPDFIRLAEDRLQRALRVQQMEAVMSPQDIVNATIPAPAGCVALKTVWITGFETAPLKPQTYETLLALPRSIPTHYAWVASAIYFNGAGTANAVFYQALPAVTLNTPSNWLLTQYPSAYLFACLLEASLFVMNTQAAQMWGQRLQGVLDEIAGNDQRDTMSGPLVAVAR